MNGKRILGQILLWAGFIGAALAANQQREFDLLNEAESATLSELPHLPGEKLHLDSHELAAITTKELKDLSADELADVIKKVLPVHEKNKVAAEAAAAEAKRREEAGETEPESEQVELTDEEKEKLPKPVSYASFEKARTTLIEKKWPTVPWLWYGLSMAVGLVGVFLLRSTAKTAQEDEGLVAEEFATLTASMTRLRKAVSSLGDTLDKKAPGEVVHFIDDECAEAFADFADARNALVQKFGLQPYAEIMTQFASAERFINRSWSAAADGYMGEVETCVARASAHLEEAETLMNKYDK